MKWLGWLPYPERSRIQQALVMAVFLSLPFFAFGVDFRRIGTGEVVNVAEGYPRLLVSLGNVGSAAASPNRLAESRSLDYADRPEQFGWKTGIANSTRLGIHGRHVSSATEQTFHLNCTAAIVMF